MPELKGYIPQKAVPEKSKKNNQVATLVFMVLVLLGLLLVYWILTRPPTVVTAKPTRGIRNLFTIYGANRKDLLSEPNAVYIHKNGDIYVADTGNNRIVIFNSRGGFKSEIRTKKNIKKIALGQLITPLGVTVDSRGRIYSASLDSGVMVFSPKGELVRQLRIQGIQLHTRGKKVYVTGIGSVYALNSRFEIVQHIGSKGRALGQFESPQDLLVDKKGNIVVSDSQNMRLQMFNKEGEVIAYQGKPPKNMNDSDRLFGLGTGLTADSDGRMYVADALHHSIRVFDPKGEDLGEIGEQGNADGLFNYPSDIDYINGNTFAIADKWNDRIQIVRINPGETRKAGTTPLAVGEGLPRWALVGGLLLLLAIIMLMVRRLMGHSRNQQVLPNRPGPLAGGRQIKSIKN